MPSRPPPARSLLVTVFGDSVAPHGGRAWLGSLIGLLAPFGISERLVRTSVYRLVQENWLRAEARGRRSDYLLTDYGGRQIAAAARHIYASERPAWDGGWRLVMALPGTLSAREREHLREALAWQGFGALGPGVYVHPSAALERALDSLDREAFPHLRHKLFALQGKALEAIDPLSLVRAAWDLRELSSAYAAFVRRHRRARPASAPRDAFVQRTLLVHEYRRLLLRDPELPDSLLPPDWNGRTARSLFAALYKGLALGSEMHLREQLRTVDGIHPGGGARIT
jgi:phenylacetic acid degradation operon negative regulatory protein